MGLQPLAEPVGILKCDPHNARTHDEKNIAAIAASLRRFGQRKPLVVNRANNTIEAGNGTLDAAKSLGWAYVAVVWVTDDPSQQTGFAIADNRSAELADWDTEILAELLADLESSGSDLLADLLLDDLLPTAESLPEPGDAEQSPVDDHFGIVITCTDEQDQINLLTRFTREGLACEPITESGQPTTGAADPSAASADQTPRGPAS